jgi:hypothetical protein
MLVSGALADSEKGLGLEGQAVHTVAELVHASELPLAASASLLLDADEQGWIRGVAVLESGADGREWQRIAEQLRQSLAGQRLRLPAHSGGVRFQLDITSRELLASGAAPKMESEVFGTAQRGPGTPPEVRVSLLPREPVALRANFPSFHGAFPQPWAGFSTNIASASADLTDLEQRSQRIVTAELAALQFSAP